VLKHVEVGAKHKLCCRRCVIFYVTYCFFWL